MGRLNKKKITGFFEKNKFIETTFDNEEEFNEAQKEQAFKRQVINEAMQIGQEILGNEMESIRESAQERIDLVQLEID